jgi:Na+/phosphate symporter
MRIAVPSTTLDAMPTLRLIDSITQLTASDAGCIAVSGSHSGISSARFALEARPLLSVFNDAGVGKMEAGIAGLAFLQAKGLAACAVAHTSACIGVAQSTLDDGIISHANALALALGITVGQTCRDVVARMQATQ